MLKFSFLSLILFISFYSNATIVTIINSGFTFSPDAVTITEGDTVQFTIGGAHFVVETNQTTWNANGNTPLGGGFTTPNGGGMVLPSFLTVGTHYYVCSPHASVGMKGTITVEACVAPGAPASVTGDLSVCPNTSYTYTAAAVTGASAYNWTLPSGWTGTSTTATINAIPSLTNGDISVEAVNNCGTSSATTITVSVTQLQNSVTISGLTITADDADATYQWFNCGTQSNITGETAQSLVVSSTGNYAVILNEGACTDTSICELVTVVGLEDLNDSYKVYPNPVDEHIQFFGDDLSASTVHLIDLNGKVVLSQHGIENGVDVSNIKAGKYILYLASPTSTMQHSIVIR
ncbi:T9SS type A sorting domain-containing protein [Paracrocinitomix mangrovi]|uniref:T9SS type A sorting domain-containing protein n=1 Tax=Paracrocinitomix mangrovi TaxID=2862509 RepID=UPI001C8E1E36|nr:T9SS type A sorting domain-containing protein [Paracrocinitomix mangrovi]UKN01842.1 T9SS type A sorting domain-containing protein [Paracrocinitomix mangrovi]